MQTVSKNFRKQAYSGEALYYTNLQINEKEVPIEQIAKIEIDDPIIDDSVEYFYVGTFIAKALTITFKNLDGLDIASNNEVYLEIGEEVYNETTDETEIEYVPIGHFLIDDLAEDYFETCEITCLDYSIKFKPNIDYSPCFTTNEDGIKTATLDTIFEYICNYFGVKFEEYPSLNGDVEVGTYDSRISGKQWISYIAELKGCNAKMTRDGTLALIPFVKNDYDIKINALESEEFTLGEKFKISRIVYFDAIRNFTFGQDIDNTLFIRQDNPFVTNESVIENLYNDMFDKKEKKVEFQEETKINNGDSSLNARFELYGNTYQKMMIGKNLLKITNGTYSHNGITAVVNNGEITLNGTASGTSFIGIPINLSLNSNTYTLSLNNDNVVNNTGTLVRFDGDNETTLLYDKQNSYRNIILNNNTTYNQLVLRTTSGIKFNNFIIKPQLEVGTNATEYEEYIGTSPNPSYPQEIQIVTGLQTINISNDNETKSFEIDLGDIELCKMGDYQDYIYKNGDKWYKHSELNKLILNGSESWTRNDETDNFSRFALHIIGKKYGNDLISDKFVVSSSNVINRVIGRTTSDVIEINISKEYCGFVLNEFKTWLSNNNTILYYILDEIIEEEITDTNLIEQLNSISLLDGRNNIIVETDNLQPYLKLIYETLESFEIWSLYTKNYGDISLDSWDLIEYQLDDETYYTYNNNHIIYEMNIASEVNTQIPTKQKEITTNIYDNDEEVKIKMIRTLLDYINGEISLQAEEQQELSNRLTELNINAEAIKSIFQITGGGNLIKNSQFLFTDEVWEFYGLTDYDLIYENNGTQYNIIYDNTEVYHKGIIETTYHTPLGEGYDGNLVGQTTSIAKIQLRDINLQSTINNIVDLKIGQTYTLSYSYTQDALTETNIQLIDENGNIVKYFVVTEETNEETGEKTRVTNEYNLDITYKTGVDGITKITEQTFQFIANTSNYILKITTSSTSGNTSSGYFNLYDLMLNSGDKQNWEASTSEIYSTILKMSKSGLQVFATGSKTLTLLNSMGFKICKSSNGEIGEVVTEFTDTGLITGVTETDEIYTGNYVLTEIKINSQEHHVEYFRR